MSSPFLGNPSEAEGSTSLAIAWDMEAFKAASPPGGRSASFFSRPPQLFVSTVLDLSSTSVSEGKGRGNRGCTASSSHNDTLDLIVRSH